MRNRTLIAVVAASALVSWTVSGASADDNTLTLKFDKGLKGQTGDGQFKFKMGGRVYVDTAYFDADDALEAAIGEMFEDGSEFRAARLYVSGDIYENVTFKAEYDFAGGDADFKDVYVGLKHLPVLGALQVGHFKEPFGLEELTSSRFITFMERSVAGAFVPSRNTGIGFQNAVADERFTYALGAFKDADGFGDSTCSDHNFTGRVTGLAWRDDQGDVMHLGAAFSRRKPCDEMVSYSITPDSHLAPDILDTGDLSAERENRLGLEAAWVQGPLSLQGEYVMTDLDSPMLDDPSFAAYYVEASYFLTGERRNYEAGKGAFDRVSPLANFGKEGCGAWQLTLRYANIDLNDEGVTGGEADIITAGVNWYLNPNTRVVLNYVNADAKDIDDGTVDVVEARVQVDF